MHDGYPRRETVFRDGKKVDRGDEVCRVLLADDHEIVTTSGAGLRNRGPVAVWTRCDCGHDTGRTSSSRYFDSFVNGIDAARQSESQPEAIIIFLRCTPTRTRGGGLEAGGSAYVLKSSSASEIREAIREAQGGRIYVTVDRREVAPDRRACRRVTWLRVDAAPGSAGLLADGKV
jgi:DNA-binding NarL/FixJ family response regulator